MRLYRVRVGHWNQVWNRKLGGNWGHCWNLRVLEHYNLIRLGKSRDVQHLMMLGHDILLGRRRIIGDCLNKLWLIVMLSAIRYHLIIWVVSGFDKLCFSNQGPTWFVQWINNFRRSYGRWKGINYISLGISNVLMYTLHIIMNFLELIIRWKFFSLGLFYLTVPWLLNIILNWLRKWSVSIFNLLHGRLLLCWSLMHLHKIHPPLVQLLVFKDSLSRLCATRTQNLRRRHL